MLMFPASLARAALHTGKMREERRALMHLVLALQPQRGAEQGAAAGGIHHVVGPQLRLGTVRAPQARERSIRPEINAQDLGVLMRLSAAGCRMLEQQLVQVLTADLHGVARAGIQGAGEAKDVVAALIGGWKVSAELAAADGHHLVEYTQALENRHVHREQGLADVKSGMAALFHQGYAQPPRGPAALRPWTRQVRRPPPARGRYPVVLTSSTSLKARPPSPSTWAG